MATRDSSGVTRTQPITIAARKHHHLEPSAESSSNNSVRSHFSASMSSTTSGDSGFHARQPRRDRPCDACRRKKSKCVFHEGQTSCGLCEFHSQECTFVQSPQPRKRKLNADGKEESVAKRRSPDRDAHRTASAYGLSSTGVTSSLIEDMANIGGPTMLKRTLGLQADRYSQYIGPTTDFEPSLIDLSPFDPQDESLLSRGTLRKVSDVDTFLLLPDYDTPGYEHIIEDADAIESLVSPHGPALIDLYFKIIHPSFPILERSVFYEKYSRGYREFSPPILAALYILAINWWDHSEELADLTPPDVRELERLARVTLADAMWRPKLSTVQAGLLLSQCPEGDQWAPTAQLVAISQELGLHLDCTHWKIPPWERGLRKRLAWALYMQDKWGSLVHGRPSHILPSNWGVQPLVAKDFPEPESDDINGSIEQNVEYEQGCQLFSQMIVLSQILADVLDTFYTLQAMATITAAGAQGAQLVLQIAKPVQLKLKEWYSALPASLRMDSSSSHSSSGGLSHSSKLSSIGFLHLAYFATEITLHRRIIRSFNPQKSSTSTSSKEDPASARPTLDPYVVHICRTAAKTRLISAMDFVNRLTTSHLRAFWYFASKTNFALIGTFGSFLWATAPGREEADWYRRRLGEYRWTLSVSSKGASSASSTSLPAAGGSGSGGNSRLTQFAMVMLDTSTGLLKGLPEKPALSRVGSESEGLSNEAYVHAQLQARRQSRVAESFGYNNYGSYTGSGGGGFAIGPPRGLDRDSSAMLDSDENTAHEAAARNGLASPSSTSVSSGGSPRGY